MAKHTTRNKHNRGLLKNDLERIKTALAITAKDVSSHAKRGLSNSYARMKDKTTDIQDNVADYVGTKPYKSLAIALVSGLAAAGVGFAMRNKRRTRTGRR